MFVCLFSIAYTASSDEQAQPSSTESSHSRLNCHPTTVSSSVEIASLRIEEVKLPLIFSLFIIIVILAKVGK